MERLISIDVDYDDLHGFVVTQTRLPENGSKVKDTVTRHADGFVRDLAMAVQRGDYVIVGEGSSPAPYRHVWYRVRLVPVDLLQSVRFMPDSNCTVYTLQWPLENWPTSVAVRHGSAGIDELCALGKAGLIQLAVTRG